MSDFNEKLKKTLKEDRKSVKQFDIEKEEKPEESLDTEYNIVEDPPKELKDATVCVVDYGTFICLAEKLGESFKKVYYYTPTSQEFYSIEDLVQADGLEKVERIHDIFEPDIFDEIDLFVFPDIGYGGLQKYLRLMGKAVWGSMGADKIEVLRTHFLDTLKKLNLPMIHSEVVKGLSNLREHLKDKKNKYIKVNKYRGNMETWHHIDIEHSAQELDRLAVEFGGLQETVTFVVQDHIDTDVEIGYDGWTVDGQFPEESFQGYEKKDELYLGSLLKKENLPKEVQLVNEALSPLLKKFGYRNFFATEIRVKDGVPYFIDPTLRMPGQTGEQMLETCENLAEIIWFGAYGVMVKPKFKYKFAAEACMHYTAGGEWKVLRVPKEIRRWVKLWHYCKYEDMYHFPPSSNDQLGVVMGLGNTIKEAITMLVDNLEKMDEEPIKCKVEGFLDLMNCIRDAEEYGIKFTTQRLPDLHELLE